MEPDIVPLHAASPPPQDDEDEDDADGGSAGSGEDEFGDFSSGLSSSFKPGVHRPGSDSPVEQSQPASTVNLDSSRRQGDMEGRDREDDDSALRLTNGHADGERTSGARPRSPKEETGFADFTVFTETAAHPWCCGFSPGGAAEQWDSRARGGADSSAAGQRRDPGPEVVTKYEPKSHCARETEEDICTKVKHCECRDAGRGASSQDHLQPQEGEGLKVDGGNAGVFSIESEVVSEDLPSFSDDLSFEGASAADMEPNVSSLASPDDSTDWDRTDDDEDEDDLEDDGRPDAFVQLSPCGSGKAPPHFNQQATQETSATSSQPQSETNTEDRLADLADSGLERRCVAPAAGGGVLSLGSLPPSDSFADFCSAPTQEQAAGSWAEFKDQSAAAEARTWTQFREPVSVPQTEEEPDGGPGSRRNSCQAALSCRVQQLLQVSFPELAAVAAVADEGEHLSLSAVLQSQHLPGSEEAPPELSGAQRIQQEMLRQHQDIHSAVGLRFQWGGSHVNSCLLSCLGVDARNIVFMGTKKQPVTLPAFASGLGLLEPTKDPAPAVCSPRHRVVTTGVPPGPRDLSARSVQEELPSSQLGWSCRGLSSSQDGSSALNLDYFGLEEESRSRTSSSSSSGSISPPPGVDRELYELSMSRLDSSTDRSHPQDTLNRLLSSAETTCVPVRTPPQDENLSTEAGSVISGLPNLSFMQAKVLMFPSVLAPTALTDVRSSNAYKLKAQV